MAPGFFFFFLMTHTHVHYSIPQQCDWAVMCWVFCSPNKRLHPVFSGSKCMWEMSPANIFLLPNHSLCMETPYKVSWHCLLEASTKDLVRSRLPIASHWKSTLWHHLYIIPSFPMSLSCLIRRKKTCQQQGHILSCPIYDRPRMKHWLNKQGKDNKNHSLRK